jgi:hypothetical protein
MQPTQLNDSNTPVRPPRNRAAYFQEYTRRPESIARNRANSKKTLRKKKLLRTMKRMEDHSIEDMEFILKKKCEKLGDDYNVKISEFREFLIYMNKSE